MEGLDGRHSLSDAARRQWHEGGGGSCDDADKSKHSLDSMGDFSHWYFLGGTREFTAIGSGQRVHHCHMMVHVQGSLRDLHVMNGTTAPAATHVSCPLTPLTL